MKGSMKAAVLGLILIQIILSAYFVTYEKKGYFADDLYSYGSSNSDGRLSPLEDANQHLTGMYTWQDGKVLGNYLACSKEEAFRFDGIRKAIKREAHPPLYFCLLHLICSLTPDVFSKWQGFAINVIGFVLLQIYLYRLMEHITGSRKKALLTVFFFGFTSVSINMMCFLRMYVLSAGLTAAYTYYVIRYASYEKNGGAAGKKIPGGILVTLFLGALTDYLFVVYAFGLSLYIVIYLMIKRKIKDGVIFAGSGSIVALLALLLSGLIEQLKVSQTGLEGMGQYPFLLQLRLSLHFIMTDVFGLKTPVMPTMIPYYVLWTLVALAILYVIACFLFRKDEWFVSLRKKLKDTPVRILGAVRKSTADIAALVFALSFVLVFVSRVLMIYYYWDQSIRYLYFITPIFTLVVLILLFTVLRKGKAAAVFIIAILLILSNVNGSKCFLMRENVSGEEFSKATAGADVIALETEDSAFMYHVADLIDCRRILVTTIKECGSERERDEIRKVSDISGDLYLLAARNTVYGDIPTSRFTFFNADPNVDPYDNGAINQFKELPGCAGAKLVGQSKTAYLYKLK